MEGRTIFTGRSRDGFTSFATFILFSTRQEKVDDIMQSSLSQGPGIQRRMK